MTGSPQLEIDAPTLKEWLESGDPPCLVDCREPFETAVCQIPGSVLVPMRQIPDDAEEKIPRDRRVVVVCHHGVRSLRVVHWLIGRGYANVVSLSGGIDGWAVEVDKSMPRY